MRHWWSAVFVVTAIVIIGVSVLVEANAVLVGFALGFISCVVATVQALRRRRWQRWLAVAIVGAAYMWTGLFWNYLGLAICVFAVGFPPVAAATAVARRPDHAHDARIGDSAVEQPRSTYGGQRVWAAATALAVAAILLPPLAGVGYLALCLEPGGYMGRYNACRDTIDIWPVISLAVVVSTVMLIVAVIQRMIAHNRSQIQLD